MFTHPPDRIPMTLEPQCTLLINCYSHVQCFSVFQFLWSRLGFIKSKTFSFLSTPEHLRVIWNSSLNWHPQGVNVFKTDVESILKFLTFTDRNNWNFLSFFLPLSFFFLSFRQSAGTHSVIGVSAAVAYSTAPNDTPGRENSISSSHLSEVIIIFFHCADQ